MKIKYTLSNVQNKIKTLMLREFVFYLFLILYSFYLIFLSFQLGLSYDEPFSLYTTGNKLSKVISLSYNFEGQPPVYFIILSLWRKINDSIFFARLLSIIFTFLSALILDRFIRLIFDKSYYKWIVVLFLINPYTVSASVNIRLYSLLILLTLLYTYIFYLIYFHKKSNYKIILVLIGVLGVYTQYYFTFLIISLSILLLFSKNWSCFLNYVLLSFSIAIIFLPNFIFIVDQYLMHVETIDDSTFYDKARFIITGIGSFFVPINHETYKLPLGWTLRIIFVILFIISYAKIFIINKKNQIQDFKNLNYLLIISLFLSITLILVYSVSNLFFLVHYLTIAYPFYILLFLVFGNFDWKRRNIIYFVYVTYFLFFNITTYKPPYTKSFDYDSAASYVQRIEFSKEPILIHSKMFAIGFNYYYKGKNPIISIPELKFNHDFYRDNLKDTTEFEQSINNITIGKHSFLLVTGSDIGSLHRKELTNEMIDNYLNNNYNISVDTIINGEGPKEFLRFRRLTKIHCCPVNRNICNFLFLTF
ncbi:glycosyltransferase family 39 protein [Dolichospermum sp. ST_sed3]|nr:glycosyltransferase family 39 protein [Dolichospermum sp. ST_sed3]